MKEFSQYYLRFPAGPPTQGDIWLNLPCPTVTSTTTVALVITPRCDFAHDKTSVFNYLPAIPLKAYVDDALSRLLERKLVALNHQLHRLEIPLPAFELLDIGASPECVISELEKEAVTTEAPKRIS